jgi:type IV secretory pathway TrbD component
MPSPGEERGVREHVIHEALYRSVLFAGAAPEFVIVEVATIFGLVFLVGLHVGTLILALFYATAGHALAVWVTAQDPQMAAVYLRSLAGKDFYASHAVPLAAIPAARPAFPRIH